ncbi:hypothetical protein CJ030_MR6G001574 [Morella rubra]|uniref:Uncharacterized protein n=1 Tax=Morella rubra TaxID=262757 RepID=A0A6A1VBY9_9ROSI|nr:hypothetical protein CJ030_MR6G001574 [Morella rubra]
MTFLPVTVRFLLWSGPLSWDIFTGLGDLISTCTEENHKPPIVRTRIFRTFNRRLDGICWCLPFGNWIFREAWDDSAPIEGGKPPVCVKGCMTPPPILPTVWFLIVAFRPDIFHAALCLPCRASRELQFFNSGCKLGVLDNSGDKNEADLLVQNKALYGDKEHLSQDCIARRFRMMAFQMQLGRGCFDVCEDDVIVSSPRATVQENGRNEANDYGASASDDGAGSSGTDVARALKLSRIKVIVIYC